jgi:pimeloyl-ACP methyl ester carboxylesterase
MMRILVALFALSWCSAALAQDEHEYRFVTIDGNKIAYLCKGTGDQVVLMISGMGLDAHSTYKNTFHNFESETAMLCLYDRPGTGQSRHAERRVRSMDELSSELGKFIARNQWESVVLVAHSFGGQIARALAHKHPDVVSGLLLVDTSHESWYDDLKSSLSPEGWEIMAGIIEWEKHRHSYEDFVEAAQQHERYELRKDIPVTVMSRGLPHNQIRQTGMRYADVDAYNETWNQSQAKLSVINDGARHVIMTYSSHLYDQTDPWIVLEELDLLLSKVQ